MKAKRNLLLLIPLLFLSGCLTTDPNKADALRESRGKVQADQPVSTDPEPAVPLLEISVLPGSLSLESGQRGTVALRLPQAAPEGGLNLDITTDIPNSIIMPVASIPAGERSVNVPMEGGEPGEGSLFINAEGYESVAIPVSVR